jgi:hypothetical protein
LRLCDSNHFGATTPGAGAIHPICFRRRKQRLVRWCYIGVKEVCIGSNPEIGEIDR